MTRLTLRLALCAAVAASPGLAAAQPMLAGAPLRGAVQPALAPASDVGPPTAAPLRTAPAVETVRVGTGAGAVRTLSLPRGKSAIVELPVDARDVMVSNPKVADVALSTPRRIYVMGAASGQTDATFVDGMGRQILRLDIRVDQDTGALQQTLARVLPGASIHVDSANDSVILSGEAASAAEADKAARLAAAFVSDPKQVVNMIAVAGGEQVMLQVKVVEVNRTVLKQLGFDLNAITGQLGMPRYSFLNSPTYGVNGSYLGNATGGYAYNSTSQAVQYPVIGAYTSAEQQSIIPQISRNDKLASYLTGLAGSRGLNSATAMIQAFERVGLVRTLAEPNLTAISGESANFLAGGEFPVPVGEDSTGRITVEFKQYGVGLGFTPVVLSSGRISLKISTEVSQLTNAGGFTLSNSSGTPGSTAPSLAIPGLTVRRAQTVVELPSGGAMAIAGLIQSQTQQTLDSLPGLMQLPVLGALLRSRDFQQNESELVVIVTPYLVKPVHPDQLSTPADGLQIADDLQTNLLGRINSGFNKPPAKTGGQTYQGPFGYVVD
ncbi:MAG: type II and III secretion system protein family protein [Caulobacteraceae bacterium]|nr:type II and III secretion system protein family protein [Caulobacter sp.]